MTGDHDEPQARIAALERDLAERRAALDAERREGYELRRERERLERELAELRERHAASAGELQDVREALGSVLESASWRLTQPLRRLRRSRRPEGIPPRHP